MMRMRDDRGVTLTELAVVSILMLFMLATAYLLMNGATVMVDSNSARVTAESNATTALNTISRDLASAVSQSRDATPAFSIINTSTIEFAANLDSDMATTETVKYYRTANTLYRVQKSSGGAYGTPKAILKDLSPDLTIPIFCFHSKVPNDAQMCGAEKHGYALTADAKLVRTVGITLDNTARSGSRLITAHNSVLVRPRAPHSEM